MEAVVGYGESLTFESWKILRVPMTTSWLQRLVRGISLQEARSSLEAHLRMGGERSWVERG